MIPIIGAAVPGIITASAVSAAIGTIAAGIVGVLPLVGTALVIGTAGKVVCDVANTFGLGKKNQDVGEFGAKAAQQNIKRDSDFETVEAYIEYISSEVELDREAFDKKTDEEKAACYILGTSILSKGIEEKSGMELSPEFLVFAAKTDMKQDEIQTYIDKFQSVGIHNMSELVDCLNGRCSEDKVAVITDAITSAISELNPTMSEKEVAAKLANMMDAVSKLEQ